MKPVKQKRNLYIAQQPTTDKVIDILLRYRGQRLPYSLLSQISQQTKIKYQTLRGWRKMINENAEWRPWNFAKPCPPPAFTHEQRLDIYHEIKDLLEAGYFFCNHDFRQMCLRKWNELEEKPRAKFTCSDGFITKFKKEFHINSLTAHFKRRPNRDPQEIKHYSFKIRRVMEDYPHSHIFNADETAWRLTNPGILTWRIKGSSGQAVDSTFCDKKNFTAIGCVCADGTKMPLTFVAKGKSDRCEETQFGARDHIILDNYGVQHHSTHSPKGWVNTDIWIAFLESLRTDSGIPLDERICLIADRYKCHLNERVREKAEELNMKLLFIPSGCTDICQPLDVAIFGALKARGRKFWYDQPIQDRGNEIPKRDAVAQLCRAWHELNPELCSTAYQRAHDKMSRVIGGVAELQDEYDEYVNEYRDFTMFFPLPSKYDIDSDDDTNFDGEDDTEIEYDDDDY